MNIVESYLSVFFIGLAATLVCAAFLAATKRWHGELSLDASCGIQKFHTTPTPRIGGLSLLAGALAVYLSLGSTGFEGELKRSFGLLLLACLPAFAFGLMEDFTKKVSVKARLLATLFSGALGCAALGNWIGPYTNVPGLDYLLAFAPLGIAFTAFCIAGVSNSINIIDGFNGLASGVVVLILGTLAIIAFKVADPLVGILALLGAAIALGFMLVNFPKGYIFLGDAGAYSLGFYVAMVSVMLTSRNPSEVSPWAMMLVCGYPVIETLFSIYRRVTRKRKHHPGAPDASHLHSLVYRRIVSRRLLPGAKPWVRNAATSPFMWAYAAVPMLGGVFWPASLVMVICWLVFSFVLYQQSYRKILSLNVFFFREALN